MNLSVLTMLAQEGATPPPSVWQGHTAAVIGLWLAVGFTLAIYTFLYKDNPIFKFAEHVFVGASNGYLLWQAWHQTVKPNLVMPLWHALRAAVHHPAGPPQPNETLWLIVPAVLCLFLFLRFIPKAAWLSRWSFAFYVGASAGNMIPLQVVAYIFKPMDFHLRYGIVAHDADGHFAWLGSFNLLATLVGVIAVLIYFVFSIEHKGPVKAVARTGVIFLMIGFGASFGYTVMARQSLLIGKVQNLIDNARSEATEDAKSNAPPDNPPPNPHHATLWLLVAIIAAVVALEMAKKGREGGEVPQGAAPPQTG
ncbi:MAG: hypothetical protein K8T20_06920 [Planctomycetes bacterium]|nr:hypothetical protein [Planctomycetota bacterium]